MNGVGINDPKRNNAMMPMVKPILRRRSGVRKIRAIALNTRPPGNFRVSQPGGPLQGHPNDYLTEPPAATIFDSAEPETLSTATFSLTAISPVPRTLTFSFLRTAPLATRSLTVTSPPLG